MERYDIIIIGAGVSGCAAARELSRDNRRIAVLERASDVCEGTSKANSGIVHAGFDAPSGTLKARLNVWGSERMEALSKELDFPFRRNGSLVLCFHKEELGGLRELKRPSDIGSGSGMGKGTGNFPENRRSAVCPLRWHCVSLWIEYCTGGKCSGKWSGLLFFS